MRRVTRFVVAVAVLSAGSATAPLAYADDIEAVQRKFDLGLSLEDQRSWGAAAEVYRQILAVKRTPQIRYHLGRCLERLGRYREAIRELSASRDEGRALGGDAAVVAGEAAALLGKIEGEAPHLVIHAGAPSPSPSLSPSAASGVSVSVDGEHVGSAEERATLDPGRHHVVVVEGAVTRLERDVDATAGATIEIDADQGAGAAHLRTIPAAAYVITGGIALAALGGAAITALVRSSAISKLDAACNGGHCPSTERATYDQASAFTRATNVLLLGSAVAVLATVVIVVATRGSTARATTAVRLVEGGLRF